MRDRAQQVIATRLAEALWREDIGDARRRFSGEVHGFDRIVLPPIDADPASLLPELADELDSAVTGLTVAYARPAVPFPVHTADEQVVSLERLAIEGHNLHPCGRTRLGWTIDDMLAHDLESPATEVAFVAAPAIGDDLGDVLGIPPGALPVHAWQLTHLRKQMRLAEVAERRLARPTASLRTVLLDTGQFLKLSLDIQVTSTRRTISIASTRNGPALSRLIEQLLQDERVLVLPETHGVASPLGSGRDLSTIVRSGLSGRLEPGEEAIPGIALPHLLPELVQRGQELEFLIAYARLLIPPVLRMAAMHGIALEAHLQNCVPTFKNGTPHRMGLRDFAGLRLYLPRLGDRLKLHEGSIIGTSDVDVMLSKVAYTVFQAHLGELVLRLPVDEDVAWRNIRSIVDETLKGHPDHAFYTAPLVPHKALTRMRLQGSGDVYVPVRNPLHADVHL